MIGEAHGAVLISVGGTINSAGNADAANSSGDPGTGDTPSGDQGSLRSPRPAAGLDVLPGQEAVGRTRPVGLPSGVTIRALEATDREAAQRLLGEDVQEVLTGGMVCLVAEYHGTVVGMLCGWIGRPLGHVQYCHLDPEASDRARFQGFIGLHQAFEALLYANGASGWTAQTEATNHAMIRMLTTRGATVVGGARVVMKKQWR